MQIIEENQHFLGRYGTVGMGGSAVANKTNVFNLRIKPRI
jgi:hypothetical protein